MKSKKRKQRWPLPVMALLLLTCLCLPARAQNITVTGTVVSDSAEVMANVGANGGLELARDYWVDFPDGYRAHQIRLEGGDCSTDSFCYPSV